LLSFVLFVCLFFNYQAATTGTAVVPQVQVERKQGKANDPYNINNDSNNNTTTNNNNNDNVTNNASPAGQRDDAKCDEDGNVIIGRLSSTPASKNTYLTQLKKNSITTLNLSNFCRRSAGPEEKNGKSGLLLREKAIIREVVC
jgi:hypothetical protein